MSYTYNVVYFRVTAIINRHMNILSGNTKILITGLFNLETNEGVLINT